MVPTTPGRAVDHRGLEVQIARDDFSDLAGLADGAEPPDLLPAHTGATPKLIDPLPSHVSWELLDIDSVAHHPATDRALVVPIGIDEADLATTSLRLWPGEHALVAGPAGSGRTTTLATIARGVEHLGRALASFAPHGCEPPMPTTASFATLSELDAFVREHPGAVVLIDDADRVADPAGELGAWLHASTVHVIAAVHAARIRLLYGHWTTQVRTSRAGVALVPDHDCDGELFGVRLPRPPSGGAPSGRGYLLHTGTFQRIQVAVP
jgi:S-DNA-T family DNA segregation ATPase FtsK/SpoIIIE